MKRLSIFSLVVATGCLLGPGVLHAEPKTWFSFPVGTTYALSHDDAGVTEIRVPLAKSGAAATPTNMDVSVIDASLRDGRAKSIADAVKARYQPTDGQHGDALVVCVTEAGSRSAGAYNVTLRINAKGAPTDYQDMVLSLQRPTLALRFPAKLAFKIVAPLFGTPARADSALLALQEPTGVARFESLQFLDTGNVSAAGLTGPGTLAFAAHPSVRSSDGGRDTVRTAAPAASSPTCSEAAASSPASQPAPPGAGVLVDVTPTGSYALGKSTGKFSIMGPAVAPEQSVVYEVTAALCKGWLVAIAALGAAAGWLVRVKWPRAQKLLGARTAASLALEALASAEARIPDQPFKVLINQLLAALRSKSSGEDLDEINAAVKAATDGLAAASADLDRRRGLVGARVNAYHVVVSKAWLLANPAQAALATLRQELSHAAELVDADNVAAAAALIDAMENNGVLVKVVGTLDDTGHALGTYVDHCFLATPPVSDPVLVELRSRCDELIKDTLPSTPPVAVDADALNKSLTRAHETLFISQQIILSIEPAAMAFIDWAEAKLEAAGRPAVRVLQQATRLRIRALLNGLSDPEVNLGVVETTTETWRTDWGSFLTPETGTIKPAVQQLLEHSQWTEAVNAAVTPKGDVALGATLHTTAAPTVPGGSLGAIAPGTSVAAGSFLSFGPTVIQGTQQERDDFRRESDLIAALQTAFFGVLFIVSILAVYGDAWVGTLPEWLAIFALAFGTDLASDSVLTVAKRAKAPAGA